MFCFFKRLAYFWYVLGYGQLWGCSLCCSFSNIKCYFSVIPNKSYMCSFCLPDVSELRRQSFNGTHSFLMLHLQASRKLGFPVLYGDGSRPSVLFSAGISSPKAVMVMYTGKKRTIGAVERLRVAFPGVILSLSSPCIHRRFKGVNNIYW